MTPYGQADTQYPQPLQMSSCTTTVPNSVRNSEPVGQTSRQAAWVQCLHTSEDISQRSCPSGPGVVGVIAACSGGVPDPWPASANTSTSAWLTPGSCPASGLRCSMKATCRQVSAPRPTVLSYDIPVNFRPSSGTWFHSLQATSQALQPMHTEVSVKKPIRGGWFSYPSTADGSASPYSAPSKPPSRTSASQGAPFILMVQFPSAR